MSKQPIQTAILAASAIGAALLSIAALSFSAPTGELSKLVYDGKYFCVSNWIEEEDAAGNKVKLPDPDGRNAKDHRLKGREDWLRMDQVEADTAKEAEDKATRKGLFEPSEKVELRKALDENNEAFFTSHFNTGATHPGPCVGSGMGTGIVGQWINNAIREDCFDNVPESTTVLDTETQVQTSCGPVVESLVPVAKMVDKSGKLGHEDHLSQTRPSHYVGPDSAPVKIVGGGAFQPHTTEQERWYFNAQWKGWDWSGTSRQGGHAVRTINSTPARQIRARIAHARLVIKSKETGKTIVVSVEDSGPALWVTSKHGVNFGAPPEVYRYLGGKDPYTGSPSDGRSQIEVLGFAADQSTKLGPCK